MAVCNWRINRVFPPDLEVGHQRCRWPRHREGDAPLVGVTKESHAADAAAAASVEMSDAEVTALESLADTLGIKRNPLLGEGNGLNDYCSVIASPFHR